VELCLHSHMCLHVTLTTVTFTFTYHGVRICARKMYVSVVIVLLVSIFISAEVVLGRSEWPRGLRHELSSLARTLRSCVRIPLKAWMSVLCVFMLLCI
jgi:hypothetical protein